MCHHTACGLWMWRLWSVIINNYDDSSMDCTHHHHHHQSDAQCQCLSIIILVSTVPSCVVFSFRSRYLVPKLHFASSSSFWVRVLYLQRGARMQRLNCWDNTLQVPPSKARCWVEGCCAQQNILLGRYRPACVTLMTYLLYWRPAAPPHSSARRAARAPRASHKKKGHAYLCANRARNKKIHKHTWFALGSADLI